MFSAQQISRYIYDITGVNSFLIELNSGNLLTATTICADCGGCDYAANHYSAAKEAERWNNKYIYYCDKGLVFIVTDNKHTNNAIVTGPIIMEDDELKIENVPVFSTAAVGAISELIYICYSQYNEEEYHITQEQLLNTIYQLPQGVANDRIYMECEHELESAILASDKFRVNAVLNELLGLIFLEGNYNYSIVRYKVIELLALFSRTMIIAGANADEVFRLKRDCMEEIERIYNAEQLSIWLTKVIRKFLEHIIDLRDIKNKEVIYRVLTYINENYANKLKLADLAENVFLSSSYLSRVIKSETGKNFTTLLGEVRVEKSKELLRNTDLSLVDIATSVGFDDQSYFTKVFKKTTGIPPKKYRQERL